MRSTSLSLLVALALTVCAAAVAEAPAHHGEKQFQNPHAVHDHGGLFGILRARFGDSWQGYDPQRDVVPTTVPSVQRDGATDNATVTWVGHATVLIQHRGVNVLTDPIFSQYASPVSFAGPRRITQPAMTLEELPRVHAVIISHDHYDHLDTATIKALGDEPLYFVPLGLRDWMLDKGISPARVHELDWWQSHTTRLNGQAMTFTATPAQHFSGRGLWGRDKTLWSSWAVSWADFSVWFGGDTGYNDIHFKDIGARLGPFDLALIPIGAYEPRWFMRTVHVNPEEAVQIHRDIGARRSIGMHWGAFVLAGEGVLTPPRALTEARQAAGLPADAFTAVAVGATRHYQPVETDDGSPADVRQSGSAR